MRHLWAALYRSSSLPWTTMPSDQDQLTLLDDRVILIISSIGLVCVTAAIMWFTGPGRRLNYLAEEHDEILLGGTTRVVPGGREAVKAARKEAKRRAKADFSRSLAGQKRRGSQRPTQQPRSQAYGERAQEGMRRESSAQVLVRLEEYIRDHKVSYLEDLEVELTLPSAEILPKIDELETRGAFAGILIDDALGGTGSSFVRISKEELGTLATFINERGRLTLAEVAAEANRMLQLSESSEESREFARGQRHIEGGSEAGMMQNGGFDAEETSHHDSPDCEAAEGIDTPTERWSDRTDLDQLPISPNARKSSCGSNAL